MAYRTQSPDVVLVHHVGLSIAGLALGHLLPKALLLINGIVQLSETVGHLPSDNEGLEAIRQVGVVLFPFSPKDSRPLDAQ